MQKFKRLSFLALSLLLVICSCDLFNAAVDDDFLA